MSTLICQGVNFGFLAGVQDLWLVHATHCCFLAKADRCETWCHNRFNALVLVLIAVLSERTWKNVNQMYKINFYSFQTVDLTFSKSWYCKFKKHALGQIERTGKVSRGKAFEKYLEENQLVSEINHSSMVSTFLQILDAVFSSIFLC